MRWRLSIGLAAVVATCLGARVDAQIPPRAAGGGTPRSVCIDAPQSRLVVQGDDVRARS